MMIDVKKRFLDHLNAAGYNIGNDDVRLWFHIPERANPTLLKDRVGTIAAGIANPPEV